MRLNAASIDRIAFTQREPIGVVVAVSAFNHLELNLIVHKWPRRCRAVRSSSSRPMTPLSCYRLIEILREAGLPQAWGQALVTENTAIATGLVTDPRVGFFSFIGSARVGWLLRSPGSLQARAARSNMGARRQ